MDDLLAARLQMAMSLAFHLIFAAIGIAMPLLMIIAEWKWLRVACRRAVRQLKTNSESNSPVAADISSV